MPNVVWKIDLEPGSREYLLPAGATPLRAGMQHGKPRLWFHTDPTVTEKAYRRFVLVGTGHEFSGGPYRFIATLLSDDQDFVFHVFEGDLAT